MNRFTLSTAALLALAMVSCNKEQTPAESRKVEINVSIRGTSPTRATGVTDSDEAKVSNLQVFVFNDGNLEDYSSTDGSLTTRMTATSGTRTIWALVNAPSLSGVSTENGLHEKLTYLSDNGLDSFVMSGSATAELQDGGTVYITVRRIVSRVSILDIETDFQYSLADKDLTVDAIYLINVAKDNTFDAVSTPNDWVNKLGHTDTAYDTFLYDKVGATVNNSTPYTVGHVFYPYPNPTESTSHEDTWSPRHTMLVVEVTFENAKGYYPIELPVLERNKTYIIEKLLIKHRPGDKPYVPVETGEAVVQITVNDWEEGLNLGTVEI